MDSWWDLISAHGDGNISLVEVYVQSFCCWVNYLLETILLLNLTTSYTARTVGITKKGS